MSAPLVSERKFEGAREKLKHKNGTYVSSRAEAMVWVPLICNTTTPRFACVINCHTVTEALSYIQVKVFLNRAPFESTKNGYLLKDFCSVNQFIYLLIEQSIIDRFCLSHFFIE